MISESTSEIKFQFQRLKRAAGTDDYLLYRTALQYDLTEPMVVRDPRDMRSERMWRGRIQPFDHQIKNVTSFCRQLPAMLIADEVGLGKTVSAGLVASELMARGRVKKILVVCPKILFSHWKEELEEKFGMATCEAVGKSILQAALPGDQGAVITTFNTVRANMDALRQAKFQMLILDEVHLLRDLYGEDDSASGAPHFCQMLQKGFFEYVLMLTSSPIKDWLWDLYSLIDLSAAAKGHKNPLGPESQFRSRYLADSRSVAIRPVWLDSFRSIVPQYVSRFELGDVHLAYPDRQMQLQVVPAHPEEQTILDGLPKSLRTLDASVQVSIAQALVSSPRAFDATLRRLVSEKRIKETLADEALSLMSGLGTPAKLQELGSLVEKWRTENPEHGRVAVFTGYPETQVMVEDFLRERGLSDENVRIYTDRRPDSLNLQAADLVVHYDLSLNPFVMERRMERVQRLESNASKIHLVHLTLKGTFDERVLGPLLGKIQLAVRSAGEAAALLETAGVEDAESGGKFEGDLRRMCASYLAGNNVAGSARIIEKKLSEAITSLHLEKDFIHQTLGNPANGSGKTPELPDLPNPQYAMDVRSFVLAALKKVGALDGRQESICFDESEDPGRQNRTFYAPGSPAFQSLVARLCADPLHLAACEDEAASRAGESASLWAKSFGAELLELKPKRWLRCFEGSLMVRARVTVAHDVYDRLIEIPWSPEDYQDDSAAQDGLRLNESVEGLEALAVNEPQLKAKALEDPGIQEFCRFYRDRLSSEMPTVEKDPLKRRKLEADLTPRLELTVVGVEGLVRRAEETAVHLTFQGIRWESVITVVPATGKVIRFAKMGECHRTGLKVPQDLLGQCAITGVNVLPRFLVQSQESARNALPEHTTVCAVSGKTLLADEVAASAFTGRPVMKSLLKTSAVSGQSGEAEYFAVCEFTSTDVLKDEINISQVSAKRYRADQEARSAVSGKSGHALEFIVCPLTQQTLLPEEAHRCEVTGTLVMPGALDVCLATGKKVLPSQLDVSAVSGKKYLKSLMVSSSISGARFMAGEGIVSAGKRYCMPSEGVGCAWSANKYHPDEIRSCSLTGLPMYAQMLTPLPQSRFRILTNLLDGVQQKSDAAAVWERVAQAASKALHGESCRVESAEQSPDARHLAVCLKVGRWYTGKARYAGLLFRMQDQTLIGSIAVGRRDTGHWRADSI